MQPRASRWGRSVACFFVMAGVVVGMLWIPPGLMAAMPQVNYLGEVVAMDAGKGTITVQTESHSWGDWTPCDYTLEAEAPNPDARDAVRVGDRVEVSTIGTPGGCGPDWVSLGILTPAPDSAIVSLYGDPSYLSTPLVGGIAIDYDAVPDCTDCEFCPAEVPYTCRVDHFDVAVGDQRHELGEGASCELRAAGYRIDVTFHAGRTMAAPHCAEITECVGPQQFCNFTVRTTRLAGEFRRGEVTGDADMNITDGVYLLNYLFLGGQEPPCRDAADSDDSGSLEISDAVAIFNFLFLGGAPPAAPYPECGPDPTDDDLSCAAFAPCG